MRQISGHHALRKGRVSLPNHTYLLTAVAAFRRPVFKNLDIARATSRCIHDPLSWGDAELLCWVLMPDHWHGLIRLGESDSLALVMNRFKARTAKQLHCGQTGLVWARGFHDRALRCDEDERRAARYIVANPLRSGLVDNVLDYPYWNSAWL
ncbi:REP-associated tyrosine transposase [Dyella telluris]|uniref:Transposase n=1 Tax=Dyella telluris TaxID=2763498 RepID=A0A7G8Q8D3_9GAMM|nr:transposase [Dyella telluris]QNK03041.1 transposase [Dyella telluris]